MHTHIPAHSHQADWTKLVPFIVVIRCSTLFVSVIGWGVMLGYLHGNAMLRNVTIIKVRLQYIYPILLDPLICYSTVLCMCQYQIRLERDMCCCIVMQCVSRYCSVVDCGAPRNVQSKATIGKDDLVWWSGGER